MASSRSGDDDHGDDDHPPIVRSSRSRLAPVQSIEKAILAHVTLASDPIDPSDALAEMRALIQSAGAEVVGELHQHRRHFDRATCLGAGRVDDLRDLMERGDANFVVFGCDLSPAQGVNLEKRLGARVIDRSQLIMDLFAVRARTHQARLQVELAQLEYSLPRLKRLWTHLDRYKGGIGMRGPGETQLELDRREIEKKISERRAKIRGIERAHAVRRRGRAGRFTVGLIGYTNAGKSTLFNALTKADVVAEDRLFTTLDTKTSTWRVASGCSVLLSDTVGFVRNLPHHLIASFHATLDEAIEADLLLHVVDGSRPDAHLLLAAVTGVLAEIGAAERPQQLVVNKVDAIEDRSLLARFGSSAIHVSAKSEEGLDELRRRVAAAARAADETLLLEIPHSEGALLAAVRAHGEVLELRFETDGVVVSARVPKPLAGRVRRFIVNRDQ